MQGVRPCPYCGGEVEVIKLNKRKEDKHFMYRIECMHCHALVARGTGFPNETLKEAGERIKQYNAYQEKILYPNGR